MAEQHDPYAPYMPEGAYVPQVGDKVMFRIGERPLDEKGCEHCGEREDDVAMNLIAKHNKTVLPIVHIFPPTDDVMCAYCRQRRTRYIPALRIVLGVGEQRCEASGVEYNGVQACANELTLIEEAS